MPTTSTTKACRRSASKSMRTSISTRCKNGSAELREADATNLFRMKGILAVRGQPHRYVLQGVHDIIELRAAQAWGSEPRSCRIVFIGRDLDRAALTDRFHACLAVPVAA